MRRILIAVMLLAGAAFAQTFTPIAKPYTVLSKTGWTCTADSQYDATHQGAYAVDGYWGSTNDWLSANTALPHYVTCDLGAARTFNWMLWYPRLSTASVPARPNAVALYVSDDNSTWGTAVATGSFASSIDNHALSFSTQTHRYIKFQVNTGYDGNYASIEELILGTGTGPWLAYSDSFYWESIGDVAWQAIDGTANDNNIWASASTAFPHWIYIDLRSSYTFNQLRYIPRADALQTPTSVEIYVSNDCSTWGTAIATASWPANTSTKYLNFSTVTASCIKINGLAGSGGGYPNSMAAQEIDIGYATTTLRRRSWVTQ